MPADNTELTVEQALAELREMFPKRWIAITATIYSARAHSVKVNWTISIDQVVDDLEGATLIECMAQARAWRKVSQQ